MRLLFQKKRWSVCNRIKYCMKYYSQYFALSCAALAVFLGFGIFRAWSGSSSGFILRASLRELLRFLGYPALVLSMLVSYEVVILILKFYQREEGALKYSPVRRLDILLTELLTVTAAAVCIILVPTILTLMSLQLTAAFLGQLFLALSALVGTMILLPVFSYQLLVIKTGKRLLFTPYLILLQVLLTLQHACYVMGEGTVLYACLLAVELVILLLAVVVKQPDQIRFYGRRKSREREKRERAGKKGMGQGRLIWIEMTRNLGMLLQFILIPVMLLIFSRVWGELLFERYVYYYMAFIPCFFCRPVCKLSGGLPADAYKDGICPVCQVWGRHSDHAGSGAAAVCIARYGAVDPAGGKRHSVCSGYVPVHWGLRDEAAFGWTGKSFLLYRPCGLPVCIQHPSSVCAGIFIYGIWGGAAGGDGIPGVFPCGGACFFDEKRLESALRKACVDENIPI